MAAGEVELRCRINVCGTIWAEGNDWGQFGEVRSKTGCVKKAIGDRCAKCNPVYKSRETEGSWIEVSDKVNADPVEGQKWM